MKKFSRKRHVAKTITWRIIGTIDTILLGWLLTGELKYGVSIGFLELMTKMALYYLHERAWYNWNFLNQTNSQIRHILKTITWRIVGTMDTILLGWIVTGHAEIGFTIGGFELITKMLLYYFHERIWYRSDFGLISNTEEETNK